MMPKSLMASASEISKRIIRPIKNTLQEIQFDLEPLLIFHETARRDGIHPTELRSDVLMWRNGPNIGGGACFLDMLKVISPDVYLREVGGLRDDIFHFVEVNQDQKTGGFRHFNGSKEHKPSPPTLRPTWDAIAILKHLASSPEEQPIGYDTASALLTKEKIDKLVEFTYSSKDNRALGGYHFNPEGSASGRARPSMWNTLWAFNILRDLKLTDGVNANMREFVLNCLIEDSDRGELSFRESIPAYSSNITSTTSTVSALKILDGVGGSEWVKDHRRELIRFFNSSWALDKAGRGGFGELSTSRFRPSLLYTNQVLSLLDILQTDLSELIGGQERVESLLDFYKWACRSVFEELLVFGFEPGWRPNAYIMRDTLRTLKSLSERDSRFQEVFNSIYGDKVKTVDGIYSFLPHLFLRRKLE